MYPLAKTRFTENEYLAMEDVATERHEFVDGDIYAMAGETINHSRICFNLAGEIRARLKGKKCEGLSPNMKVRISKSGNFFYPDLTVVCGRAKHHQNRRDILTNPRVVFEVLSPSTAAYDQNRKQMMYLNQIQSLTDYVIVSQDSYTVQHYQRQADGRWLATTINGLEATLSLPSLEIDLPLAEIYDCVDFDEE